MNVEKDYVEGGIRIQNNINITLTELESSKSNSKILFNEVVFVLNQCRENQITSYAIDDKFKTSDVDAFEIIEYLINNDLNVTIFISEIDHSFRNRLSMLFSSKVNLYFVFEANVDDWYEVLGKKLQLLNTFGLNKKTTVIVLFSNKLYNSLELKRIINQLVPNYARNVNIIAINENSKLQNEHVSVKKIADQEKITEAIFSDIVNRVYISSYGDVYMYKENTCQKLGNFKKENILAILNKIIRI